MDISAVLLAILLGILQGIFEWLPISSEGNLTILLTALGTAPEQAVRYSLFLHLGTATAAIGYFQSELRELFGEIPDLLPSFEATEEFWFLAVGTIVSGVVGVSSYVLLIEAVSKIEGAILIVLIGALLIVTGLFQFVSTPSSGDKVKDPSLADAVIVGIGQGLAVLPGVSRSGTTVGIMLLRGYSGPVSFRLSFILSIPAALGAGVLVLGSSGGIGQVTPVAGITALVVSGLVGYATIDALMRVVERVTFWVICVGLGGVAIIGGLLLYL